MSIYDSIGGAAAASAVVDELYARVLADPSLEPYFAGTDMARLKGHQRAFIAAALGGPDDYEGKTMAEAHAGRNITPEAFGAVVFHLVGTLESLAVDDETISRIAAALAPLEGEIVTAGAA